MIHDAARHGAETSGGAVKADILRHDSGVAEYHCLGVISLRAILLKIRDHKKADRGLLDKSLRSCAKSAMISLDYGYKSVVVMIKQADTVFGEHIYTDFLTISRRR